MRVAVMHGAEELFKVPTPALSEKWTTTWLDSGAHFPAVAAFGLGPLAAWHSGTLGEQDNCSGLKPSGINHSPERLHPGKG